MFSIDVFSPAHTSNFNKFHSQGFTVKIILPIAMSLPARDNTCIHFQSEIEPLIPVFYWSKIMRT
jgi:hypothetical protein